jgi:hypothetical protein
MVQNLWRHSHLNCQQAPIAATLLRFQGCPENAKITKSVNIYKDIFIVDRGCHVEISTPTPHTNSEDSS